MNQTPNLTQHTIDPYTVNVLRSQFHMQLGQMAKLFDEQLDAWLDGL